MVIKTATTGIIGEQSAFRTVTLATHPASLRHRERETETETEREREREREVIGA